MEAAFAAGFDVVVVAVAGDDADVFFIGSLGTVGVVAVDGYDADVFFFDSMEAAIDF